ncbi:MAG: ParB N-terminal domain-containing protein [Rhizobiaceae bacterium]|nr:ParB N-terminal domain-containing protein [Rhizobiaceae bacterium]
MTDGFTKSAHATQWIPVKNLSIVWATAQREFNERHADKIASGFDPDLFDDLVVTLPNGNGIYHVVDGQHRKAAIQKLYGEDEKVPCRVVNATDPSRAAAIFDKINTGRRSPSAVEKFKVRVTAGYEDEVAINKVVTWLGYRITGETSDGTIRAVAALMSVYKTFGLEVLKETLMTIKGTWSDDCHAVDGPIIEGFAALIGEHRGHLDFKRLREQTAKKFTPGRLIGNAKGEREITGGSLGHCVSRVLIRQYDQGLRNGKLGG